MIIFVGGLIGAGKSTIARLLAESLGCGYLDADETKKVIFKQDPDYEHNLANGIPFSDATRMKVFDQVIEDMRSMRGAHRAVVIDETLHRRELRHRLYDAAKELYGDYLVVWVRADEEVILQRLKATPRVGHILKDPVSMHEAFRKSFEQFQDSVIICNNNGRAEDAVASLKRLLLGSATLAALVDIS